MKNLTDFDDILNKKYGKRGTAKREKFERGFEAFKLGVMIRMAREEAHSNHCEHGQRILCSAAHPR